MMIKSFKDRETEKVVIASGLTISIEYVLENITMIIMM